jgi:hypothetical protein
MELSPYSAKGGVPLLSINSLMRPPAEPDDAQNQRREDSNIKHCINHISLHQ